MKLFELGLLAAILACLLNFDPARGNEQTMTAGAGRPVPTVEEASGTATLKLASIGPRIQGRERKPGTPGCEGNPAHVEPTKRCTHQGGCHCVRRNPDCPTPGDDGSQDTCCLSWCWISTWCGCEPHPCGDERQCNDALMLARMWWILSGTEWRGF